MTAGSVTLSAAIRQGDEQVDSGAAIEYDAGSLAEITRSAICSTYFPQLTGCNSASGDCTAAALISEVPVLFVSGCSNG